MGDHGPTSEMPSVEDMLVAQNLRDATMAFGVGSRGSRRLVLHINGSFHSADRLCIPEHVARTWPLIRMLVVTMNAVEDIQAAPEPTDDSLPRQVGDFIILTDEGLIED